MPWPDLEPRDTDAVPEPSPGGSEDEVARILARLREGDEDGLRRLFEALYTELHRRARRAVGRNEHTLQPTALVHEAYLRVVRAGGPWNDRKHFLLTASRAMRHLLVDHFRRKRLGERTPLEMDLVAAPFDDRAVDVGALDEVLQQLAARDAKMARAVELRFFGGASLAEVADLVGIPQRTFERRWAAVRSWLWAELS